MKIEECVKATTKNVYKAEEVDNGKIENSQRPIKRPYRPLAHATVYYISDSLHIVWRYNLVHHKSEN